MLTKKSYIVVSVLLSALLMSIVDAYIQPPYFYKSAIKVVLFLALPLIYFYFYKDEVQEMKKLWIPKKKDFLLSLVLGIFVYIVIFVAYLLFKEYIDFAQIVHNLTAGIGVNASNFLYVAMYISFINSLLEEFFFRGYAFIVLKKHTSTKFAYIFSALLFALYHIGMTSGWFHPLIYVLAMLGLFIGGCIFNFLNAKCENMYPSWLVHMFANFAINTIGCILFGII